MKLIIEIPKEFEEHFRRDKFEDSLHRLSADVHLIAGNYEQETAIMLINAFKDAIDVTNNSSHVANFFGMTVEAERRVMKNTVRLIREVVDDYVFGCDSGNEDWKDYYKGISDELDEIVEKADYPSDFCYRLPSDEWLFKKLISQGTTRGGMGSAIEECSKIGKVLKGDEEQ